MKKISLLLLLIGLFLVLPGSAKALSTSNDASFDNIDITTKSTFFKSNKNDYLRNNLVINDPVKDMGVGYTVTLSYCVSSVTDISSLFIEGMNSTTTMLSNAKYSFKGANSCIRKGSRDPGYVIDISFNAVPTVPIGDNELDSVTKYKSDVWINFNYHENNLGSTKEINFISYSVNTIPVSVIQNNKQEEANETSKGIWGTIKDIFSKITNLPGLIWNAIKGGFEAITNALVSLGTFILDGIKSLFIPKDMSFITNFVEAIEKKLGFIAQIPMKVITFSLNLANATWTGFNSISFPSISIFGYKFWNSENIDLTEAINIFKPFKYVTDVACVAIFVKTLLKWWENFTGGGSK